MGSWNRQRTFGKNLGNLNEVGANLNEVNNNVPVLAS